MIGPLLAPLQDAIGQQAAKQNVFLLDLGDAGYGSVMQYLEGCWMPVISGFIIQVDLSGVLTTIPKTSFLLPLISKVIELFQILFFFIFFSLRPTKAEQETNAASRSRVRFVVVPPLF